eukprot:2203328-Prymnesium_polylepis.1
MHGAAAAAVLCHTSCHCRSLSLVAARPKCQNRRWFARVALPVRCILSKNKIRVSSFGLDQDPRDVKRVAGA